MLHHLNSLFFCDLAKFITNEITFNPLSDWSIFDRFDHTVKIVSLNVASN